MKLQAFTVDDNGDDVLCCTIVFDGKQVQFTGTASMVEFLQSVNVGDKLFTPKDGKAYMEALPLAYGGSRFYVTPVKE